jgi:hypothetical protein
VLSRLLPFGEIILGGGKAHHLFQFAQIVRIADIPFPNFDPARFGMDVTRGYLPLAGIPAYFVRDERTRAAKAAEQEASIRAIANYVGWIAFLTNVGNSTVPLYSRAQSNLELIWKSSK